MVSTNNAAGRPDFSSSHPGDSLGTRRQKTCCMSILPPFESESLAPIALSPCLRTPVATEEPANRGAKPIFPIRVVSDNIEGIPGLHSLSQSTRVQDA